MMTRFRQLRLLSLLLISLLLLTVALGSPFGRATGASVTLLGRAARLNDLQGGSDPDGDMEHIQSLIDLANSIRANLGPGGENNLSSGGLLFVTLGDREDSLKKAVAERPGSNPLEAEDFISRQAGSTQSETSVAWCGDDALIGFNDSGSFALTILGSPANPGPSPSFSFSFNGWSRSTDAGRKFTDKGTLVSDPLPAGVRFRDLVGDPVVGCTDRSTFYYSSLAEDTRFSPPFFVTGVSVSKSVDGGSSFGGAVLAVGKDARFHFLDKPWMAVKPSGGSDTIHVTYTDFDSSINACGTTGPPFFRPIPRAAIEYVRSIDGGATFSAPIVIDQVCGFIASVQGSHVQAGLGNDVYVAWEVYPTGQGGGATRQIKIAKSTNGGSSFGAPILVSSVTPVGTGFRLQGRFRDSFDFQGLAVDRSSEETRGNVYITWQDGRNLSQSDRFSSPSCDARSPRYCFGDIFLTRSTNGGTIWSPPVRVNDDPIDSKVDQFMPAVEVDKEGKVFVFFYDRRRDPRNFLIDTFIAISDDGITEWKNKRLTKSSFAAIISEDILVNPAYMGDYIGIAVDATGGHEGVILAWGDNSLGDPNVNFVKLSEHADHEE